MVYAVIDTNIIVSSFITKNPSSATRRVINSMLSGKIKPLYNEEILDEYFDVLNRSKFHLSEIRIHELLNFFKQYGIDSSRFPYDGTMPDEDDRNHLYFHTPSEPPLFKGDSRDVKNKK